MLSNVIKLLSNAFTEPAPLVLICISPGGGTLILVLNAASCILMSLPSNETVVESNLFAVLSNVYVEFVATDT